MRWRSRLLVATAGVGLASGLCVGAGVLAVADQISNPSPVNSVNGNKGDVIVPSLCRQQSTALALPTANPGSVSWTFPNTSCAFAAPPSCWMDVTLPSGATYAYDQPSNSARTTSAVTYAFSAHSNTLSVSVLGIAVSLLPGTISSPGTVIMTCTAPPV